MNDTTRKPAGVRLSARQRQALSALSEQYATNVDHLADLLDTSPQGAVYTAQSLVRRGLAMKFRVGGKVTYYRHQTGTAALDGSLASIDADGGRWATLTERGGR